MDTHTAEELAPPPPPSPALNNDYGGIDVYDPSSLEVG